MKIGVGICTYKRPKELAACIASVEQFNRPQFDLHVQEDEPNIGIGGNKNRILKRFRDYDIIIILEDDTEAIREDWLSLHIEAYNKSGIHHFSYVGGAKNTPGTIFEDIPVRPGVHIRVTQHTYGDIEFFTRKVLDICGGFHPDFKGYGWEHMEYSCRIARAGLAPKTHPTVIFGRNVECGFPTLSNAGDLIKSIPVATRPRGDKYQRNKNLDLWAQSVREGWIKCPI